MNILYVTGVYPPIRGGASENYRSFVEGIAKEDSVRSITVLTSYTPGASHYERDRNRKIIIIRMLVNYKIIRNRLLKSILLIVNILQFMLFSVVFKCFKRADIIQIHSDSIFIMKGMAINPGVYFLSKTSKHSILDIRDKVGIPKRDLGFSIYLANSKRIYEVIKQRVPVDRGLLIYSPIRRYPLESLLRHSSQYRKYDPYICFLGTISKSKGVFQLLDAMSKIQKMRPMWNLNLVICGEYMERLRDLPQNCKYLGALDHFNAMSVLVGSRLVVLPSLSESLPRVCIEALIYERPVLTVRGVPEVDEALSAKHLVESIEPDFLAERILNLVGDHCTTMKNSYDFEVHDENIVITKLFSLYKAFSNGY